MLIIIYPAIFGYVSIKNVVQYITTAFLILLTMIFGILIIAGVTLFVIIRGLLIMPYHCLKSGAELLKAGNLLFGMFANTYQRNTEHDLSKEYTVTVSG